MKKFLSLLIALFFIAGLAACNGEDPTTEPGETTPDSTVSEPDTTQPDTTEPDVWQPDVGEVSEEDMLDSFVDAVTGDTEQGPVWFYLYDDGSGYQELYYTPEWGDNWQYSSAPTVDQVYFSIFDQEYFRSWAGTWAGMNIKIVIGWRAYQDGNIEISEWDYATYKYNDTLMDTRVENGVVTVLHNDEEIYTGTTTLEGENVFEGKQLEVVEGDMVFFVMDGENSDDAVFNNHTINVSYKD